MSVQLKVKLIVNMQRIRLKVNVTEENVRKRLIKLMMFNGIENDLLFKTKRKSY